MDLKKLRAESARLNMPESAVYLMKVFESKIADLESRLSLLMKHVCLRCADHTTVGGSAIEYINDVQVKPSLHVLAQIKVPGATPVTIVSAECEMGRIKLTFSGNPGNDHEITYHICK